MRREAVKQGGAPNRKLKKESIDLCEENGYTSEYKNIHGGKRKV
jgi:hypothetical protein